MNALLPFDFPPGRWDFIAAAPRPDWLQLYREAEAEALAAAEAVRVACDRYKADRNPETLDAYKAADRAYDRARLHFQLQSCEIIKAVRAVLSLLYAVAHYQPARGRML